MFNKLNNNRKKTFNLFIVPYLKSLVQPMVGQFVQMQPAQLHLLLFINGLGCTAFMLKNNINNFSKLLLHWYDYIVFHAFNPLLCLPITFSTPAQQYLSRKDIFNLGNKFFGYSTKVRSFGYVLPDESVRVFIGPTFPRMVRFTKIEGNI